LFIVLWAATAHAATLTFAWDPVGSAKGFVVYWGTQSGTYSNHKDVGNTTTVQIGGLANGMTYYVSVRAYNDGGLSGYAAEVAARLSASGVWLPAVGDFNADGKADLVWRQTASGDLALWQMSGASVVQTPLIAAGVPLAWHVTGTGDFDGDGQAGNAHRCRCTVEMADRWRGRFGR
jgi:hypothetical protein